LGVRGVIRSPITGPAGNVEFLMHLSPGFSSEGFDLSAAIAECLAHADKQSEASFKRASGKDTGS
jgi:hypothetical protein